MKDRLLQESMIIYKHDWVKVAEHINTHAKQLPGGKVDDAKCRGRYYRNLRKSV
jgi:hypothetical protein